MWKRLLAQTVKQDKSFENDFYSTELVSQFADLILSLGRLPKTDEITAELKAKINKLQISQTRLAKIAISTISVEELSEVRKNFETEILLFLSINMLMEEQNSLTSLLNFKPTSKLFWQPQSSKWKSTGTFIFFKRDWEVAGISI